MKRFGECLTSLLAPRPVPPLSCGDCPRTEQCGRPPDDDCLMKFLPEEARRQAALSLLRRSALIG